MLFLKSPNYEGLILKNALILKLQNEIIVKKQSNQSHAA
jgi:hypothetical protein